MTFERVPCRCLKCAFILRSRKSLFRQIRCDCLWKRPNYMAHNPKNKNSKRMFYGTTSQASFFFRSRTNRDSISYSFAKEKEKPVSKFFYKTFFCISKRLTAYHLTVNNKKNVKKNTHEASIERITNANHSHNIYLK